MYETLQHLALQKTNATLQWEIIVVDNASVDNTMGFAKTTWVKFKKHNVDFKVVEETEQGLTFARQRGVSEAKYQYIIFCDDDNWLNSDYVQLSFDLMEADNTIGVLGGENIAVSDVSFPEWFPGFKEFYAVGRPALTPGIVNDRMYICGAGMVTRKKLFQDAVNKKLPGILYDRKGNKLSSGGDVEYCLRILLQGYNLFFSEQLILQHFISADKLTEGYRNELSKGIDESRLVAKEYAEALKIKSLGWYGKSAVLINAVKDIVKSFIMNRKPQEYSQKILFYFFNIGFKNRNDLKLIKRFYHA